MDAANILSETGFRTFGAETSDKTIVLLERDQGCIVLHFSDVQMNGSRNRFALARETAQRWPHISIVNAFGSVKPEPGDMPDGARFIGKPFSISLVHQHNTEILPDGQKPDPLKDLDC